MKKVVYGPYLDNTIDALIKLVMMKNNNNFNYWGEFGEIATQIPPGRK